MSTTPLLSSIDDAIEACTSHGSSPITHLLPSLLVAFAWFFDAQQTFVSVFTDAEPSYQCLDPNDKTCAASSSPCGLERDTWQWESESSVVSEWGLECAAPALVSLPASAFFVGCLVGGLLLSTLADSILGRKRLLVFSCLAMSMAGISTIFSPNIWVYSALRFICGFARAAIGTCVMVLSTEIVSKKWRDTVSICGFVFCNIGFLSLPLMAYMCRMLSWRTLYLWISLPSLCYAILIHFTVQESPRWLLVRGRKDEAVQTLKNMASLSGNQATLSFSKLHFYDESTCDRNDVLSSMRLLWERKWAWRRLTVIMIASFGVGIVYYGIPLNVGNLSSNLYLSATLNALAELPSSLVTYFLVEKINRRSSLLTFTTISGIFSFFCIFPIVPQKVQMIIEVISFFSACTAFNIILIYGIELFPTCVRNSALSLVRQALVLGGVLAPLLVVEGRKEKFWSFGVFGLVVTFCGLVAIFLPETRGRSMCDTMEEEEYREINEAIGDQSYVA